MLKNQDVSRRVHGVDFSPEDGSWISKWLHWLLDVATSQRHIISVAAAPEPSLSPPSLITLFFIQHQQLVLSAWGSLVALSSRYFLINLVHFLATSFFCRAALLRSGAICWPCSAHAGRVGPFPATDTVTIQARVAIQVVLDVILVRHTSQLFLSSFQTADFLPYALYQHLLLLSFTSCTALPLPA